MHNLFATLMIALAAAPLVAEQPPAPEKSKLFESVSHDFGTVPRGAQLLHKFTWTNDEKVQREVGDIRSSCGCATATALPRTVAPGQKGIIEVLVDAKKFVGQKTIHVQLLISGEKPQAATLELSAHCRPDVVCNPGEVNFGVMAAGATSTQTMEIEYAGQLDWHVEELLSAGPHLDARYEELYRKPGQVGYRVHVTLKPDAPTGDFKHELQLRTNDTAVKVIPVLVQATIRARLMAAPNPVFFGTVREKQTATRRVVLRGDKPFQILKVEGAPAGLTISTPSSAAAVQTLTLSWTPETAGELNAQLTITTDLDSHGTITVPVQGQAGP